MERNRLYPCGDHFESYLEYGLICPQCGEVIRIYLPADRDTHSYTYSGNTCHPFHRSIDRGRAGFYAHKMIRITDEIMGSRISLYDNYHVYPLVPGETAGERQARLVGIKEDALSALFREQPQKKRQIIEMVAGRNENILCALEPILKEYEKTPEPQWSALDAVLQSIRSTDDAKKVLSRLGLKVEESRSLVPNDAACVGFVSMGGTFGVGMASFGGTIPARKVEKDHWFCPECGNKNTSKFCPCCGTPNPKLAR